MIYELSLNNFTSLEKCVSVKRELNLYENIATENKPKCLKVAKTDQMADRHMIGHDGGLA